MTQDARKIVIVGGGIAGLCAAVYARKCGYDVELLEMHDVAGGLATSWRRDGFTFETCLHWLLGSNPRRRMYTRWREVFDIGKLTFVHPEEYVRLETQHGDRLIVYADVDRMEAEFLKQAPADASDIREFASAVRRLAAFEIPDLAEGWRDSLLTLLRTLPYLPLLRRWSRVTTEDYSRRFSHPLLRRFFSGGEMGHLSALVLALTLAWTSRRDAGYPIGGSRAIVRLVAEKLDHLGGRLRLGAKVEKILVEGDAAVGVRLAGGETIAANWVVSAADGHATIYDLLAGTYKDDATDLTYRSLEPFPSYVQVSLGVARDLSEKAGYVTLVLDAPLAVDPDTWLREVSFRFFHFDPTFAPPGKTAVTCVLPTRNFEFWVDLQQHDASRYEEEKHRIAEAVIAVLESCVAGSREAVEVIDVSTPATVIRYTGNWKGSMEGWLPTPATGFRPLRNSLPGLRQFLMVGQWVQPGGGLPSGLLTARSAIRSICRSDRVPFVA